MSILRVSMRSDRLMVDSFPAGEESQGVVPRIAAGCFLHTDRSHNGFCARVGADAGGGGALSGICVIRINISTPVRRQ
jgi:hypothetical protein